MTDEMKERLEQWLGSTDTGISSKSIAFYMAFGLKTGGPPSDGADFGRCQRLLGRFPEWSRRIGEMEVVGHGWEKVAPRWEEIANSESPGEALSLIHWPYDGGGFYSAVPIEGGKLRPGAQAA